IGAYEYGDVADAATSNDVRPMPDAVTRDVTSPLPDASIPIPDAWTPLPDASTPDPDASADASSAEPSPATDGGCGCRLAARATRPRALLGVPLSAACGGLIALGAVVLLRRRAQRRRTVARRLTPFA